MPSIGILMMGADFKELSFGIGDAKIKYGMFIQATLDFIIIALVLFMVVKIMNTAKERLTKRKENREAKLSLSKDQEILIEIRDLLKKSR